MTEPRIIEQSIHGITRDRLSRKAVEVIEELHRAGFSGELVGGCVRDLLCGKRPKDFDVATKATPEQVQNLFKRSYIIGRRFRLVEVLLGFEVVQVATYRAEPGKARRYGKYRNISTRGKILRDNNYGDIEQDAFRRDLTINSLYLNPEDMSIIDYTGGYEDMQNGIIRVIGNPSQRYKEDPVRILRAIRFAAMLGFQIDDYSLKPIRTDCRFLKDVPNSRLADEIKKLFFDGFALSIFELLLENGVFTELFQCYSTHHAFTMDDDARRWLSAIFEEADDRARTGKQLSLSYLLATVLWLPYKRVRDKSKRQANRGGPIHPSRLATDLLNLQNRTTRISKPHFDRVKDIWHMQSRMESARPDDVARIAENRNFRAAFRLLALRARNGEVSQELCDRWREVRNTRPKPRIRNKRYGKRGRRAVRMR